MFYIGLITNTNMNKKKQNNGKLYQIKDFSPKAVMKVKDLVDSGKLKRKIELNNMKLR